MWIWICPEWENKIKKKIISVLFLGLLILCTGCSEKPADAKETVVKAENLKENTESDAEENGYLDVTDEIEGDWQDKESGNFYTFDHGRMSIQNTEGKISEKTYGMKKYSDRYELEVTDTDGRIYTYNITKTQEHTLVIETADKQIVLTAIIYQEKES